MRKYNKYIMKNAWKMFKNGFAELSTGVLKCNWLADN